MFEPLSNDQIAQMREAERDTDPDLEGITDRLLTEIDQLLMETSLAPRLAFCEEADRG